MNAQAGDGRLTLLYIEDNPSNLLLVERIFRDRGDVDLHTAIRGQQGLEMVRAVMPGLILLDLHLPDMPGAEVLEALRSDPLTAAIPVVVVSADATADQIASMRASGVADYVTKPFEVPRLLAIVDSFAPDAAAPREPEPEPANGQDEPILDPQRVAELFGLDGDGTAFRSLAAVAFEEAAEQIARISSRPGDGGDATAVGAAAHSLKSSAAIVGARRLALLADTVEQGARAGSLPDRSMLSDLRRTLTATRRAVADVAGGP
jgi:CheY-like chemotaxis protein/HPt (histidine-containing phosphotransfer) domain-containing protein